ncbi:DUF4202 domain-containing protein [Alkalilimnicola ehrlichii]|uniref:DUF4202 domain-containing protein n=1 Tax=Alkalilimnicola ehrlichii TaxID=351052 RepID=UPI001C6E8ABC|nr:DUF4202 domain-containing protein [Alkalilimnicola ehrlichii]
MSESSSRFEDAIARLDAVHAQDPRHENVDGEPVPAELLYAQRMSDWLERLLPDASEALRLAVRSQHLRRWRIPRADYPLGRAGYHAWRRQLMRQQADEAAAILREAGYDDELCERVASLVRKENLRRDAETQALEDAACLVFLQHYFADFAADHSEEKLVGIVRKTWNKMSDQAKALAGELSLSPGEQAIVEQALAEE